MKNIQAQYQDLLEGKMSKSNFMRNVRMQFPQHVSSVTSFDDSVRILKGKRILSEAKQPEGVYGHNPNAETPPAPGIDQLNYYQVYHGIQYELAKMPEITDENYVKARKKVVDTILKDPDAYKDLQLANFKAVKEMDKDLEMKEVKKNNLNDKPNEMKVVKKDAKENTQATLEKKEKKKSKTAKIPVMTQTPKGKLEAFATPGKEKTLKENLDAEKEGEKAPAGKVTQDDLIQVLAAAIASNVISREKALEMLHQIKLDEGRKSKAQELKEHILDEMTTQNPHHEDIHKGMTVYKKKGDSGPGKVIEFDGHTATVEWENGAKEDVQKNVLTKQEPAKTTMELPSSEPKVRTMFPWANESEKINEDPVGQQAAGDPEAEKGMRDTLVKREGKHSMLKRIKERLIKALKKETQALVVPKTATGAQIDRIAQQDPTIRTGQKVDVIRK